MKKKLAATSAHMREENGPAKAAKVLDTILRDGRYHG